jgi:hypothetical protein
MTEEPQTAVIPPAVVASVQADPVAAKTEADSIIRDKSSPYWDSGHYQHHQMVDHVTALMSQVHGDVPAYEQGEAGSETSEFTDQFDEMMAPPEDSSAYDFSDIQLAENEEWNSESEDMARGWLHQLGAGEAEAKAFAKRFDEFRRMDADALERMPYETEATLKRHWGEEYEANVSSARAVVEAIGPEFAEFLKTTGLANDHALALALHRIAKAHGM